MEYNTKFNCYGQVIEIDFFTKNDELYILFDFCCRLQRRLLIYPIDEVCKDFDKYYLKALNIVKEKKICERCEIYNGFKLDDYVGLNYGLNLICSHNCAFCAAKSQQNELKNKLKLCNKYSEQVLKAILKTKVVKRISPSCRGEPFENPYIRDIFLFNIHKTSINSVTFLTNGIKLTDVNYLNKLYEYFNKHNIEYTFIINLSGFDKETYESYCSGKFEVIKQNIKTLVSVFGNERIFVHYIISDYNKHLSKSFVDQQFKLNFPDIPIQHLEYIIDFVLRWDDTGMDKVKKEYLTDELSIFDNAPIPISIKNINN